MSEKQTMKELIQLMLDTFKGDIHVDKACRRFQQMIDNTEDFEHENRIYIIEGKLTALEVQLESHHKQEKVYLEHTVNCEKKIEALEEKTETIWFKLEDEDIFNRLDAYKNKIEALESEFKQLTDILCSDEYGSIIPQLKELRKQLEAKP